jgi:hypothetical protein
MGVAPDGLLCLAGCADQAGECFDAIALDGCETNDRQVCTDAEMACAVAC